MERANMMSSHARFGTATVLTNVIIPLQDLFPPYFSFCPSASRGFCAILAQHRQRFPSTRMFYPALLGTIFALQHGFGCQRFAAMDAFSLGLAIVAHLMVTAICGENRLASLALPLKNMDWSGCRAVLLSPQIGALGTTALLTFIYLTVKRLIADYAGEMEHGGWAPNKAV